MGWVAEEGIIRNGLGSELHKKLFEADPFVFQALTDALFAGEIASKIRLPLD